MPHIDVSHLLRFGHALPESVARAPKDALPLGPRGFDDHLQRAGGHAPTPKPYERPSAATTSSAPERAREDDDPPTRDGGAAAADDSHSDGSAAGKTSADVAPRDSDEADARDPGEETSAGDESGGDEVELSGNADGEQQTADGEKQSAAAHEAERARQELAEAKNASKDAVANRSAKASAEESADTEASDKSRTVKAGETKAGGAETSTGKTATPSTDRYEVEARSTVPLVKVKPSGEVQPGQDPGAAEGDDGEQQPAKTARPALVDADGDQDADQKLPESKSRPQPHAPKAPSGNSRTDTPAESFDPTGSGDARPDGSTGPRARPTSTTPAGQPDSSSQVPTVSLEEAIARVPDAHAGTPNEVTTNNRSDTTKAAVRQSAGASAPPTGEQAARLAEKADVERQLPASSVTEPAVKPTTREAAPVDRMVAWGAETNTDAANTASTRGETIAGDRASSVRGAAIGATAPSSEGPVPLDRIDHARFLQRVTGAFQAANERGGPVRLRLHPPELGALRLEVSVRDGAMTARLEADNTSARNLLLENIHALRERLASHDIRIDKFDVTLSDRRGDGSPDGPAGGTPEGRDRDSHDEPGPRRRGAGRERQDAPQGRAERPNVVGDDRLNVVI